jgi:hypothetical protein
VSAYQPWPDRHPLTTDFHPPTYPFGYVESDLCLTLYVLA